MAKVLVTDTNLTAIANSIRAKNGSSDTYTPSQMATAITNLPSGANLGDYFNGTFPSTGGSSSKAGVINCIKKIYLSDLTPSTSMKYAFNGFGVLQELTGSIDTSNITDMSYMFSNCTNLTKIPNLNTSAVKNMSSMFSSCVSLTSIPQLDTSVVTNVSTMFSKTLTAVSQLVSIPLFDFGSVTNIANMFYGTNYTNLTQLGGFKDLGKAYLTSSSANYSNYVLNISALTSLTHDSLMNVINNLYDIATAGCNTQKLVLGNTNLAKLSSAEIAIATNKGWTVS